MSAVPADLAIGSPEHRSLMARFFLDTHVDYVPEQLDWPQLADEERARLTSMPFWQEAVSTENVASNTVAAAAALESDPLVRKAIELQGFEEHRHARLLVALATQYRIKIEVPPRFVPGSLENDFLRMGFGECFDSFFAFGLYAIAQESGYFAPALTKIFEPVIQEEARHILFFVNWVKYRRRQLPWYKRPLFRLRCARIIVQQVMERAKTAKTMNAAAPGEATPNSENFTLSAGKNLADEMTLHKLLGKCLQENERRMAGYDARLRRPRLVPGIAKVLYRLLPSRI